MARNKLFILALIFGFGWMAFDANAQQTKKQKPKPRRTTNTVVRPQPTLLPTLEPEVISRATDEIIEPPATANNANGVDPDLPNLPQTLPNNSVKTPAPIDKSNSAREKEDRSLLDLERLSLAETRAEAFRKQLSDAIDREASLRSKIEQLEYQMRPESIQIETAVIGSLRPEEMRETRRKMIENEKARTAGQLSKTLENRTRLELAVANADALVDKLRARVEAETADESRKSDDKISVNDSVEPTSPDN